MKHLKNTFIILIIAVVAIISACSSGNKDIPDVVDYSLSENAILNSFTLDVSGDTTFTSTMLTDSLFNSISNDSVVIAAADALSNQNVVTLFGVLGTVPGTYSIENTDSTTVAGLFILQIRINNVMQSFPMTHGSIVIDENNTSTKTLRGKFDVSNDTILFDKYLRAKAVFKVAYR